MKWIVLTVILSLFASFTQVTQTAEAAKPEIVPDISTHAEAAALIDVESGRIVYSHNGDKRLPIASLTKVMTAIVAIESGQLTDPVKVGPHAYRKEGSSLYLQLNETMSLEQMLYGLMLRSGNDAATAIAEHVGGSLEGFVYLMNQKAAEIGMRHSHFANPHGLDDPDHYSTANDMARLTAYALQNATFQEIVKTQYKQVPNPNEDWNYSWRNKNKMLTFYEGADGVKTGYTTKSGRCLISSATRSGQQFAAVTLNDGDDWADHRTMLDYGFANYPERTLIRKGEPIQGHSFVSGATVTYPLIEAERTQLSSKLELIDEKNLDYTLGERGAMLILLNGHVIEKVPLVVKEHPLLSLEGRSTFRHTEVRQTKSYKAIFHDLMRALFMG